MSTKHYCDRCGAELSIKAGRWEAIFNKYTAEDQMCEAYDAMDLCGACVEEIQEKKTKLQKEAR